MRWLALLFAAAPTLLADTVTLTDNRSINGVVTYSKGEFTVQARSRAGDQAIKLAAKDVKVVRFNKSTFNQAPLDGDLVARGGKTKPASHGPKCEAHGDKTTVGELEVITEEAIKLAGQSLPRANVVLLQVKN